METRTRQRPPVVSENSKHLTASEQEILRRKIALYRCIISHMVGIVTAVAELDLGFKVDLKKRH